VVEGVARLGCRKWKVVALNREGWRKLLKEADAHLGCSAVGERERDRERERAEDTASCTGRLELSTTPQ
jgi:BRCT domain type II-containing protein